MTEDSIALRELLEKSADADLLRPMIAFAAERLRELEVQALTGATYGQVRRTGWRSATATASGTPLRTFPEPHRSCQAPWHDLAH